MKHDAIDQKSCVDYSIIDYDDSYTNEMKLICGPFYRDLARIFPSKMGAYVLLTRKSRRHVWFAYLAALGHHDRLRSIHRLREELRHKLLYSSAKALLADAYGDLPDGLLGVIKSPCVDDLGPDGFMLLYRLLADGKVNALHLHGHRLGCGLLDILDILPAEIAQVHVAMMFPSPRHWRKFQKKISMMELITGRNLHQGAYNGLLEGMKPETALAQLLGQLAFPVPILMPCDKIKHIANAEDLFKAASAFENCLQHKLLEALSGNYQFYIYHHEDEHVVFAITKFTPCLWKLDEIQKKDEPFVSLDDLPDLAARLEHQNIHTDSSEIHRVLRSIMCQ